MAGSCVKVSGAGLIPAPIRRLLSDKDLPIERPTKIELVI
jgi:hypothetical protein